LARAPRGPAKDLNRDDDVNGEGSLVSGVAGRYATALFDLAREAEAIDQVASELAGIGDMIEESDDFRRLVRSPVLSAGQQLRALEAILGRAGIGGITANFLKVVARNRRLFALPDMIRGFARLVAEHRGEVAAEVMSAHELDDEHRNALTDALKASLGKEIKLTARVDPALLGGLVVRIGSRMIDTSLRTKLNSLRLAMKEVG
jgi:F-type H+-transporting ATPase subunit delta